jgi:hypothetical protein
VAEASPWSWVLDLDLEAETPAEAEHLVSEVLALLLPHVLATIIADLR